MIAATSKTTFATAAGGVDIVERQLATRPPANLPVVGEGPRLFLRKIQRVRPSSVCGGAAQLGRGRGLPGKTSGGTLALQISACWQWRRETAIVTP